MTTDQATTAQFAEDGALIVPLLGAALGPETQAQLRVLFRAEFEENDERIQAWRRIADHPFFKDAYDSEDTLINAFIAKLDALMPKPWLNAEPGELWEITTKDGGEKTLRYAVIRERDNSRDRSSPYFIPVDHLHAPRLGLPATVITAGRRIYPTEES